MRTAHRWISVIAGSLFLIGSTLIFAQDWPQWRGPNRDGKVTGFVAPQNWPQELTQSWRVTVGSGDATPAMAGEKLYVFARQGEDEVTLCLDAATGDELWRNSYAAQAVTGPGIRHPGPRSSPAVAEGKVVTLGVGGILSCLDAATGEVVWRKDEFPGLIPAFFTGMSPIIVDGTAIAHLGGTDDSAIMAFDLATGDVKWKSASAGPVYASPVLMTVEGSKQIVVLTEKNVTGLAVADGRLLWKVPLTIKGRATNAASPIVDGQTVIYTGQGTGTRAVKIVKQGDGFVAEALWTNAELGTVFNTPVVKDGLLFGLSGKGNLFCMNARTGEELWIDGDRRGRFGSILDAGSVMLALLENSELIAFEFDGKEYVELARIKVADSSTYAHPVIAGNRVFVKGLETLTMATIGEGDAASASAPSPAKEKPAPAPGLAGSVAAGRAYYEAESCGACHGENAGGGDGGPDLRGATADSLSILIAGAEFHGGGGIEGITAEDVANLTAYLASIE